jgi:phosphosulfolactate synthase (CoM biosynthesis protein A)
MSERAFSQIPLNVRSKKPRSRGLTEIRGPYYSVMGRRYLEDILDTMHPYVDGLKFAGGSFALMPRDKVEEMIQLAHRHNVYVSTGGWIEHVLRYGASAVEKYLVEAKAIGFDVIELSAGFISMPDDDLLRLIEQVAKLGLKPKPELGIQFGAGGGATTAGELAAEGTRDAGWVIGRARACLDAGAHIIMIESEGITEKRRDLANRCGGADHRRAGERKVHVRGRRPAGLRVVRQKLRRRGQPLCRPQPNSAARMPALGDLGNQEQLGPGGDLPGRLTGTP